MSALAIMVSDPMVLSVGWDPPGWVWLGFSLGVSFEGCSHFFCWVGLVKFFFAFLIMPCSWATVLCSAAISASLDSRWKDYSESCTVRETLVSVRLVTDALSSAMAWAILEKDY